MGRIIKITESQLKRIVDNHINEQTSITTNVASGVQGGPEERQNITQQINPLQKQYPCIPTNFLIPFRNLKAKGYDVQILKTALSIIGRESHFAGGTRYNTYGTLKSMVSLIGGNASHGPAQMRPETAKDLGFTGELDTEEGALDAAYRYLIRSYNKALSIGYNSGPSNVKDGSGNGALDIAIASYNIGVNNIKKWCNTNDKNIKADCNSKNGQYIPYPKDKPNYVLTVSKQEIKNYVPNISTKKTIEGVNTTTHGYVKTVADNLRKLNCI